MRRTVHLEFSELLRSLMGDRPISLHDPGRNIFITFPGCVLNHYTMLSLSRLFCSQTDTVIVIQVLDRNRRFFFCYIVVS